MCGESFWKGIVVFCLAFGLSVFVAGFFIPKELPKKLVEKEIISFEKNDHKSCESSEYSDPIEKEINENIKEKARLQALIHNGKFLTLTKKGNLQKKLERIEKNIDFLKSYLKLKRELNSQNELEYPESKKLLYLEKCYEF